ncbi:HD domain-containing protein [Xenorhabdus sp. 42]|uniref:HD domain-containing protein n=1 Tax=Xenorhabdus szentirmaii TaxID=290112 RepID=UPI001992179E|nr:MULTISPECIES: HD domain-containing protein [unclassified Xenorhabdus]MBD2806275.1 HD domain-containing protein [Xenorhabdus sp. ZM]MBD2820517.1 HD domain-containing protein [Xenorhabdus sp. 42]MBD2825040.1 HD domain-containing protein [Xenorhabdus sp. 5]
MLSFSPFESLAQQLLPLAIESDDGAHDIAHLYRVWKNAQKICEAESGNLRLVFTAVLLHDCVSVEKNSPNRHLASRMAAEKATLILKELQWNEDDITAVCHAIEAHSFSAALTPRTLEAQIVQDADRLDSIGLIGISRCFYTSGRMGSSLYDFHDPLAKQREYDEKAYAVDHFYTKLFKIESGFQTASGKQMAHERAGRMKQFLNSFLDEIQAGPVN